MSLEVVLYVVLGLSVLFILAQVIRSEFRNFKRLREPIPSFDYRGAMRPIGGPEKRVPTGPDWPPPGHTRVGLEGPKQKG